MEDSRNVAPRRGMAIFAVLSLMVVFTVLGVAAISIAQRDNSASGSVFDIKQREAAAYAGLVYAQNELARDPVNLLAILESWRLRTVYGTATPPFPALYLRFNTATNVQVTTTNPGMFTIPGTTSKILVEVVGITLPTSASEEPRIALRSTGSGAASDEQTLLGVYSIKNIRVSTGSAVMPITHPFYVSGAGTWDNTLSISNGNAYFGNTTHLNGSARDIIVQNAGLRIYGDFEWDALHNFIVDSNVYINGNFIFHGISGTVRLKQNFIVTGNIQTQTSGAELKIDSSLYVLGAAGMAAPYQSVHFVVGKDLYMPNGNLHMDIQSWVDVKGSAFIKQVNSDKSFVLDVGKRLELSGTGGATHLFKGIGKWGQLVVRNAAANSSFKADNALDISSKGWGSRTGGLQIAGATSHSWVAPSTFTLGDTTDPLTSWVHMMNSGPGGSKLSSSSTSNPIYLAAGMTATKVNIFGTAMPAGISPLGGTDGFETGISGPRSVESIAGPLPPSDINDREPDIDLITDPTAINKAWTAVGSASCQVNTEICGKSIQEAYDADLFTRQYFHNDFFVVRLDGNTKWGWDAGNLQTSKLRGKFFFYVSGNMAGGDLPWPTTETNPDTLNPQNVIFVYGRGAGQFFDGFNPRFEKDKPNDSVTFTGYVRYDQTTTSAIAHPWTLREHLIIRGALHIVGPNPGTPGASRVAGLNINSNTGAYKVRFNFDQAALNAVGTAFGTNFIRADGTNLGLPPGQFLLMENWIQFRTLGELR